MQLCLCHVLYQISSVILLRVNIYIAHVDEGQYLAISNLYDNNSLFILKHYTPKIQLTIQKIHMDKDNKTSMS